MTIRGRKIGRGEGVLIALIVLDLTLLATNTLSPLAATLLFALLVYGWFRFSRTLLRKSRLIWRLRNRLIVTYVFVAVVPIVLILALAGVGTYLVAGQVAGYLVTSELDRRAASLSGATRFLAAARPRDRATIVEQMTPLLRDRLPGVEVLVTGDTTYRYPVESLLEEASEEWADYTGTILQNGRFYCVALTRHNGITAIARAPVTAALLEKLVPGIGALRLYTDNSEDHEAGAGSAGLLPSAVNTLDFAIVWPNPLTVFNWTHHQRLRAFMVINTRPSAVLGTVFGGIDWAQGWLLAFLLLAGLLAVVELVSALIGISMTRTITGAVHNLYEGTLRIGQGDFAYRIPVHGYDQLADLGSSFNKMIAQLQKMVTVEKEKERLQSELDIASEVQNQLFPRAAPPTKTIELTGGCVPARSVSGDYYDYLCLPNGTLAIAIGDVAGKGISAALLMASIQSIMRTQLSAGVPMAAAAGSSQTLGHCSTSGMVAQLNRQLYANTSPEKYATFFFGLYDEHSRVMTYTNAGHLPPLLVHGESARSLEVTGTVVGLFPSIQYQEQHVVVGQGDLLILYTDGITEPENAYGEEFGEQRLTETVLKYRDREPKEIVAKIMEAVTQWSTAPELPDDMTVVIARGI